MKISKKLREEAAQYASAQASHANPFAIDIKVAFIVQLGQEEADAAFRLAGAAQSACLDRILIEGFRSTHPWLPWAEAEAMLRTGWKPKEA